MNRLHICFEDFQSNSAVDLTRLMSGNIKVVAEDHDYWLSVCGALVPGGMPGGSSSGGAVCVGLGITDAAIGTGNISNPPRISYFTSFAHSYSYTYHHEWT